MKMISSEAGERLAKAKANLDRLDGNMVYGEYSREYADAVIEYEDAADDVADELIAQGFGNAEGD